MDVQEARYDQELYAIEAESRDEDTDPDPPDFEAIYRDWDAYDAQQQEAGQAPGLVPAGRHPEFEALAATEKAEKAEAI